LVVLSNTVVDPIAMMIELFYAFIAGKAMLG
jgi:hypothetical protein